MLKAISVKRDGLTSRNLSISTIQIIFCPYGNVSQITSLYSPTVIKNTPKEVLKLVALSFILD